jgi:outer membrane protein TolC
MRSRRLGSLLGALSVVCSSAAAQGLGAPAVQSTVAPLTLQEALQIAVTRSPNVDLAARDVDGRRGALVAAGDPFDPRLSTLVGGSRETQLTGISPAGRTDSVAYGAGGSWRLRSGIIVQPEFTMTGASSLAASRIALGQSAVKVGLQIPLQKDRGGILSAGPERAARHEVDASRSRLRQAMTDSAYLTVSSYWEYVTAVQRRAILAESEARAARLVDETRILVQADERTAADLTQLLGNLAAKRAVRLDADLGVTQGWERLVLAMGVEAAAVLRAATPATPFPSVTPHWVAPPLDALINDAQMYRADLVAAARQVEASQVLVDAARNDLQDRLDLFVAGGYKGRSLGGGADRFFTPLFWGIPGFDASFQVRYEFVGSHAGSRGRLLQHEAFYEAQRVALADLQRHIAASVLVAVEVLKRSTESLAQSQEAGRLFSEGVQNEERKFRLGLSTLFDVIQAADGLTNARLAETAAQRDHAVAIATLRYQAGTLLRFDEERPVVEAAALLTPP